MRVIAPPAAGSDWLTTSEIDWDSLTGRVVILGFWTLSCDASWAHLERLKELADALGPRLVVLAIHSPRLEYEKDENVVADAVARAGIRFPVVHDPDLKTWNLYNPGGWPATVVIDHLGDAIGMHSGIANLDLLMKACGPLVAKARDDKRPSAQPVPMPSSASPGPTNEIGQLGWPSGLALLDDDHLVVSDSGHNRLLVLELRTYVDGKTVGKTIKAIGGLANPGPMCAVSRHQVAVSLPDSGRVIAVDIESAVAGILADDLGRPRGLALDAKGSIVVADSLRNQLLRVKSGSRSSVIAGSGLAGDADGRTSRAALSEPVSVLMTQAGIVFLDSASNNIRLRTPRGVVRTTTTGDIQEANSNASDGHQARLQNPHQLLALADGSLIVVDTGNNRLRKIESKSLSTVGVTGFCQPEAAVVLPDGRVIVADTGNHRLVVVDLENRHARELVLEDVPKGRRPKHRARSQSLRVRAGSRVSLAYPAPGRGPWEIKVSSEPPEILGQEWTLRRSKANGQVSIPLAPTIKRSPGDTGQNVLDGELVIQTRGTIDLAESETSRVPIRLIG